MARSPSSRFRKRQTMELDTKKIDGLKRRSIAGFSDLILTKALALRVGADFKRDRIAVGTLAFRGLHAPEVRHAGLVIRIAFEVLSENDHRLAAEVHAARTISWR